MSLDREAITNGHGGLRKIRTSGERAAPPRGIEHELRELMQRGPTEQEAAEVLGAFRLFELALLARQIAGAEPPTPEQATAPTVEDWLTPLEAAKRLRRTRAWVYRQAQRWSFVSRPSRKTLLISERGLSAWLHRH